MSKQTKATVKVAAKPVAKVAKPAATKAPKIGAAVIATTSRSAIKVEGRFAGSRTEPSGLWFDVNIAPKGKKAEIKSFRPAQVVPA